MISIKKAVKLFALVLAVAMVIGSFAGCGKDEELTGGSYTFWTPLEGAVAAKDTFNNAWGISHNFYLEGDKVKFGPFQKEYKAYLQQMNEWLEAGYIDPDYITND
ncbi:MAG: hypothetical protein IJN40_00720 [Clostridia bacterium]|nr:hypothetical protein [Clostridia bacterium]